MICNVGLDCLSEPQILRTNFAFKPSGQLRKALIRICIYRSHTLASSRFSYPGVLEKQSFLFFVDRMSLLVDPYHMCLIIIRYSSLDKMYERVLWAITNCESIDADFAAGEIQGPSVGGDSDGDE